MPPAAPAPAFSAAHRHRPCLCLCAAMPLCLVLPLLLPFAATAFDVLPVPVLPRLLVGFAAAVLRAMILILPPCNGDGL